MPFASRLLAPYRAGLAGLDRRVWVVVAGSFLAVAGRMSLVTFLAIYFVDFVKLPVAIVGAGLLLENLARGLVAPLAGALSDRVGRKPVLLVGVAGLALVLPLFLLVTTPVQLVAWSLTLGFFGAVQQPASSALLLDLVPPARRQGALALNYTAISLGYTLGVAPAGFVFERSHLALGLGSSALFVGVFLLYALGMRGPTPREAGAGASVPLARQLSLAPRDRAFLAFAAAALVFPVSLGLTSITSTVYASSRGLSDGAIGLILSVNGVLLMLFAIPIQARLERHGPYRLLGASALFIAASMLLIAYVPDITLALTLHVLAFTSGEFIFGPIVPAAVAALAPLGARGAYQGAWGFLFAVGSGSALFLSGLLKDAVGWTATWTLAAALCVACAASLLALRGWFKRVAAERANAQASVGASAPR